LLESRMGNLLLAIVLLPLGGAILAGLFGRQIGRSRRALGDQRLGVALSFVLSCWCYQQGHVLGGEPTYNQNVYTWMSNGGVELPCRLPGRPA
jgi:NADH-quinone oxidoreductase subunit L